ncbi:hypothetical protein LguiA_036148 [Lonicera macranthoides]
MRGRSYTPSPPRGYSRRGRSPSPRGRYSSRDRDLPTSLLVRNLRHDCRAALDLTASKLEYFFSTCTDFNQVVQLTHSSSKSSVQDDVYGNEDWKELGLNTL